VKVTFRSNRPGSVAAWIWNRGKDLWALTLPALIVLKLTGVIDWSWWWVVSPLWISGRAYLVLQPTGAAEAADAGAGSSGTGTGRSAPPWSSRNGG